MTIWEPRPGHVICYNQNRVITSSIIKRLKCTQFCKSIVHNAYMVRIHRSLSGAMEVIHYDFTWKGSEARYSSPLSIKQLIEDDSTTQIPDCTSPTKNDKQIICTVILSLRLLQTDRSRQTV